MCEVQQKKYAYFDNFQFFTPKVCGSKQGQLSLLKLLLRGNSLKMNMPCYFYTSLFMSGAPDMATWVTV